MCLVYLSLKILTSPTLLVILALIDGLFHIDCFLAASYFIINDLLQFMIVNMLASLFVHFFRVESVIAISLIFKLISDFNLFNCLTSFGFQLNYLYHSFRYGAF